MGVRICILSIYSFNLVPPRRISRILGPLSMPGNIPIGIFLPRRMWSGSIQIWFELVLSSASIVHPRRALAHEVRGIAFDSEVLHGYDLAALYSCDNNMLRVSAIKCGFDNVASFKRCCLDPASRQLAVPPNPERVLFGDRKSIS